VEVSAPSAEDPASGETAPSAATSHDRRVESGATTIWFTDPDYPIALAELRSPPERLRIRGTLPELACARSRAAEVAENTNAPVPLRAGVAIVGTRDASEAGQAFARFLAARLASSGIVIWSGGARGIDRAAHEGALEVDGRTILVTGAGLDVVYPPDARDLYARAPRRGAVLSLSEDDAQPRAFSLLARNQVLAALSVATVVVECPLRSGARSTSAAARKLGRPTFIAAQPPWSPFAATVGEEQRLGASVFSSVDVLVEQLLDRIEAVVGSARQSSALGPDPLGADATLVLAALTDGPLHPDVLCDQIALPPPRIFAALAALKVAAQVVCGEGGRIVRV
jgi:DNA processing protein